VAFRELVDSKVRHEAPAPGLAEADDAALARALIEGTPGAPRVVWDRFLPLVRRIVQRSLGPEHDPEDVVQEAFLCLFKRVHTLRDPGAFKAFIISITVLTALREIRRRKLRRFVGLSEAADIADSRELNEERDAREALSRFYRILDRLRARDRTAFVLRFIEGMEVAEVASAMGLSVPTVRRSFIRGWQRVTLHVNRDPFLAEYLRSLGPGGDILDGTPESDPSIP
jgi:RNA polymerase sigma-70 factor, ECF subfamily